MIRNIKAITLSSYVAMLFLGIASALIGAAARNIGLTAYQIGLMISVQNVGFGVAVAIAGALSDTYEKPRILLVGSLILAASFLTFYLSPLFGLNLVIMFLIGAGTGAYEGVTDAMLLALHTARANRHININHFFVTLGSLAITLYLIFLKVDWRVSVVQAGIAVLVLAVFFALARLPNATSGGESYLERLRILRKEKTLAVLFLVVLLAVGVEVGTIGIMSTFLAELRGFTLVASKIGLMVYLGGLATGRLLMGLFSRKDLIPRYILLFFATATVLFAVLFLFDFGIFNYVMLYVSGLALSSALPMLLTLAGLAYPQIAGTVLGVIKIAIPAGGFAIPFIMSMIAGNSSLLPSLLVFPVTCLAGFLLFLSTGYLASFRTMQRKPA